MNGVWRKARCFPQTSPSPQPLCHNPGLTSTNSDSASNQVFVSFSQKWQNCIMLVTNRISVRNVCVRNIFAKTNIIIIVSIQTVCTAHCTDDHFVTKSTFVGITRSPIAMHGTRNRADSINHTSNLYAYCRHVLENGYWNKIIHSIHSVHWMKKLAKPCRPYQNIEAQFERRQTLF